MSGKHFNRTLRVHKLMLEALERLLLENFEQSVQEDEKVTHDSSELLLTLSKKFPMTYVKRSGKTKLSVLILLATSNFNSQ